MPDVRPLSAELAKKAAAELNEVPERIDDDLEALRKWIGQQRHLRARTTDQFLITFLRGCKYSLERAKEKLDLFYTVRTAFPEMMANRNPNDPKTMEILRLGVALPLPLTDAPDGPRIMLIRPGTYEAEKYHISDVMRVSTMVGDILMLEDDNMVISGQMGILDLANVTMAHFLQFNPSFIKKVTMMSQEASPLRQKGFHYVNTPNGFELVYNMFKNFMSPKNQSRLYVHGSDMNSLYEHIPKRMLPAEYGGDAGPIQNIIDEWEKKVLAYADFFRDEDQLYGSDEKLRVGTPKNAESLFGLDGSFRKLNVD